MSEGDPEAGSGIGWLRVVLWVMPTALLVALIPTVGFLALPFAAEATAVVFLALVGCLAYFDALLHCQQTRISPEGARSKKILWTLVFLIGQFSLAPFVLAVIATIASSSA